MPKKTFFNLPKKKQQRIVDAAAEEFAEYPYSSASVGRIIKRAKIASGSFYQYFENKLDLYKHVYRIFQDRKIKRLSPLLSGKQEMDFFSLFRKLYSEGIKFALENPRLEAIGTRLMKDKELLGRVVKETEPKAVEIYENILRRGIEKGDIRDDINIKLTAYFLFKLGAAVIENIIERGELNSQELLDVDCLIDFVKNGIGKD